MDIFVLTVLSFFFFYRFRNNVKHIKIPYEEGAFYLTKAISFASVEVRPIVNNSVLDK